MELGQDLNSRCNHPKAVCTYICEILMAASLWEVSLSSVKTLCRNQLKLSALFARDEMLE